MKPPFIRLDSCCNLVKNSRNLRWKSVRSLAYTTCSDVSDSSSDTSAFCHPLEKQGKLKAINIETYGQLHKRSSALLFIRQLKESRLKHDLETYIAFVRLVYYWDWGLSVTSDNLLMDVIKNTEWKIVSFEISDDMFEALIKEKLIIVVNALVEKYASVGRFEKAIHTLSEMKSRSGLMVSTRTCNILMFELIKRDKVDMVESVYRQLQMNGLIPDLYTYGILMTVHCRKGCLKEAWGVFEQMEEAGVEPDAFIYSQYIFGLCLKGKTDLAFQLVKSLRDLNKPVDIFAYSCVIGGFFIESKLQDAVDVLRDMRVNKVVPNASCYRFLVLGYCLESNIVKALDLCKEMESRGIKPDHLFLRSMMESLCDFGRRAEALDVFKHFRQQSRVFPDKDSFNIAIDAARKLGKTDDAMVLLDEMEGRKINPAVMHALGLEPTGTNQ